MAAELEESYVVNVPNLQAENGQNVSFAWGRGNKITTYVSLRQKAGIGRSTQINEVHWETSLYNPETRKLVSETNGIFMMLQRSVQDIDESASKSLLVRVSRMYRSIISDCATSFRQAADAASLPEEQDKLELQTNLFYRMELIWHLCEILFIDIQSGGSLLQQLLSWIRWHFSNCEKWAKEAMEAECPEKHEAYWNAVYGFLLQGRIEEVRKLLHLHTDAQTDYFISLDELLRKMPIYAAFSGQSLGEFEVRWRNWQEECLRRLDEGEFACDSNLEKVCRILCGEREVFEEVRDLCETWYHLLVSRLLYINPSVKGYELRFELEDCIDMFGGMSQLDALDVILLAVFQFDVAQVIKESSLHFDSWWFVTHLTDLLYHSKQIDMQNTSSGISLRESLLLDYATCLVSHHSLWQIAVDYLDHCPTFGRHYLEIFLERIPIDSEWKARKVLHIAQKHDLQDLARSVCKIVGMQSLQNGCLGSALTWALKSKDSVLATYLADKFLSEYCEEGRFSSLDLLDSLGSSMLVSDRLTFLGKYREFHKLYEDKDFKSAAALLVSLLSSRMAPRHFWMTLLLDALPLLESDEVILNSEQTYELLYCLEELDKSSHLGMKVQEKTYSKLQQNNTKEKEELIRLALARNLARTFVNEESFS